MAPHRMPVDGSSALDLAVVADTEVEFARDIWDVRHIPGARYADYDSQHLLRFTGVPGPYRPAVKQFIRTLLLSGRTRSSCALALLTARAFLAFFATYRPGAQDFQGLQAADIEAYLGHLCQTPYRDGRERTATQINRYLWGLAQFLDYLQRVEHPLAPTRPLRQIIWPEHTPVTAWYRAGATVKLIPASVMEQLDQHLHRLRPKYIPMIILLRASGWRISDVLNLRYDTCLEPTERGWWLCGDIQKTKVLGHKVPITAEIAAVVQAQRALVERTVSADDNPKRYLFPATTGTGRPSRFRRGRPISYGDVWRTLNRLAITCQIRGPDGAIFRFRTHAFRHTKAVELINNGMSLATVQHWLAHASPEMTLAYAKVLDATMHCQWEEAPYASRRRGGPTRSRPRRWPAPTTSSWRTCAATWKPFGCRTGTASSTRSLTTPPHGCRAIPAPCSRRRPSSCRSSSRRCATPPIRSSWARRRGTRTGSKQTAASSRSCSRSSICSDRGKRTTRWAKPSENTRYRSVPNVRA